MTMTPSSSSKTANTTTILILGLLALQVALSAGILLRVNEVYRIALETGSTTRGATTNFAPLVRDVSSDDDPFVGPSDAPITIVEFSDFGCGHCRAAQEALTQVKQDYGDQVRIVYRDFPLEGPGSASFTAAQAAECADDQGAFWVMHDLLFEKQPAFDRGSVRSYAASLGLDVEQFDGCLQSDKYRDEILHDRDDGLSYGVSGTPTFFVNGRRLVGSVSNSVFEQAIEDALKNQ